jgi:hypothetical protein
MKRNAYLALAIAGAGISGVAMLHAQTEEPPVNADHAECVYFGPRRAHFQENMLGASRRPRGAYSRQTQQVVNRLGNGGRAAAQASRGVESGNLIDRHIFGVLEERGIQPAARTSDYEFIRRVTLDLTGRVPAPERVLAFVNDGEPGKRERYVEELLQSSEWVDKWTMFFGDLYRNTDTVRATNTVRRAEGREAFYRWIYDSLKEGKPYNRMAYELIAAEGTNSWENGFLNWQVGNRTTGGPVQDHFDQMAAATMETFLGNSTFNCIMCHNGRGHVDTLSLWGKRSSRLQAYGFAAFFAQTNFQQQPRDQRPDPNIFWWRLVTNRNSFYLLNTSTGNRPPRIEVAGMRAVPPAYPFGEGEGPAAGEPLRMAAARMVTADFNFARATVNYLWKELMVRGLVEPVNQMDPDRLDPDNPPEEPWTLQPSNAALLRDLAQDFINNEYSLRELMRRIVTSEAYQLSARYDGDWNPEWESLHARRLVKRLWAEEIHDAVAQTSNLLPNITITATTRIPNGDPPVTRVVNYAMQTTSPASRGSAAAFMNPFYPGDREETERRRDGSDQQALTLMNNTFVISRTRSTVTGGRESLLRQHINKTDAELIDNLFLTVLSRPPDGAEVEAATAALKAGNRQQAAENLLWSLYNKVDFFFNY